MGSAPDYLQRATEVRGEEPTPPDRLERVAKAAASLRALYAERTDAEARVADIQKKITQLETKDLVDLFSELGIPAFSLDADGNSPAVDFERKPFYSARIPDDGQTAAFAWLEAEGHADLIKSNYSLDFGMGSFQQAQILEDVLNEKGFEFSKKLGVHTGSLTAFVKRQIESGNTVPLDLLGAHVGEVVKMKERKAKKITRG